MKKSYLLTPGPTTVPSEVLLAMAKPIVHHRTPAYGTVLAEVKEELKYVFQTQQDVLVLVSTGTGAMEGSIANLHSPGDTVIIVRGGKFGERWGGLAEAYGLNPIYVDIPWGTAPDPAHIAGLLRQHPETRSVLVQLCESSTGTLYPARELAAVVRETDALLVVDGISALGADELRMDEWGLDVVLSSSQKAFMLPPGLAFAALSDRAWARVEQAKLPRFYFDFRKHRKALAKNEDAFTGGVSLIMGLQQSCRMIRAETIEGVWARHARLASAARAGYAALGLGNYSQSPSNIMSVMMVPDGIDGGALVKYMRNDLGVDMAGGQDQAKGKIVRMAHLGYAADFDVIIGLTAIEMGLAAFGHEVERGAGVRAAEERLGKAKG